MRVTELEDPRAPLGHLVTVHMGRERAVDEALQLVKVDNPRKAPVTDVSTRAFVWSVKSTVVMNHDGDTSLLQGFVQAVGDRRRANGT
jgi:hypothetical protein